MEEDLRRFQGAVQKACHVFGVEKLFPEQENALKAFISREDVLLNLKSHCERPNTAILSVVSSDSAHIKQ